MLPSNWNGAKFLWLDSSLIPLATNFQENRFNSRKSPVFSREILKSRFPISPGAVDTLVMPLKWWLKFNDMGYTLNGASRGCRRESQDYALIGQCHNPLR